MPRAIAHLHADSWRRNYRGAFSDAYLDGDLVAERLSVWSDRLRPPHAGTFTIVAEHPDPGTAHARCQPVVGLAHTILGDDPAWGALLDNLHVSHAQQGRGIGTRLMAETAAASSHATRPRRSSCGSWPRTRRPRPSTTPGAAPASSASPGARSRGIDCATPGRTPRGSSSTRPRSGPIGSDTPSRYPRQMADRLVVRGAREHNLRDVSLDLPRDKLIVFTGLSGSGKSSLAFDTIYAEGQRRYVESLSAYARQFLGQMDKPDVDFIEGLSPAISIDQKSASRNPRSTVGTITEVYDYLRLLYARIGHPHCPTCGRPVARQTPQQIVDRVLELAEGTRFQVLAPVVRGRKGEYSTLLDDLAKQGFARVRVDGVPIELADRAEVTLARYEIHTIEVVVDRLIRRGNIRQRLTESIETALELTGGTAEVLVMNGSAPESDEGITFSQHLACTHCGISFEEPAPRSFSFNSPYGACPACVGLGTKFEVDPELVVPDDTLSLADGALAPWAGARSEYFTGLQAGVAELGGFAFDAPWKSLKAKDKKLVLYGTGHQAGPRHLQEPLRAHPLLRGPLRGHRALAAAPARRGRVGLVTRADRAVHARGGLPRLPRGPPQARVAGRDRGRRNIYELCSLSIANAVEAMGDARAQRPRAHDRRPRLQGSARADAVPARCRPRLPLPGPLGRHALGRRGAAHPPGQPDRQRAGRRALRARRALHRPAPARQPAPDRHAGAAAQSGQHGHRGRARRGDHPQRPTTWWTSGRARGSTAAPWSTPDR